MKYHVLTLALLLVVSSACSDNKSDTDKKEGSVETILPDEITQVTIEKLVLGDFNHELISNGKLASHHRADLKFQSQELIAKIYVRNGDQVKKGQKLAELDKFKLENSLKRAEDALERAKLDLQDVLIGQGYLIENLDAVPEPIMKLAKIKSSYDLAVSNVETARYELEQATMTAPFDGIIANLTTKEYNYPPSDAFCTLIDNHGLEASFTVLESELSLIKKGDRVTIRPFVQTAGATEGRITEINPLVDENGMVKVRASVNNAGQLFEGMNVRVSVLRSVADQLVVPKTAVVLRTGRPVVFTYRDGKSFWNYVQTGLENSDSFTITAEGIKEGDMIITSGNINLADESPVKVVQ